LAPISDHTSRGSTTFASEAGPRELTKSLY